MPSWKVYRGADSEIVGVAQFATTAGATLSNFNLTGAVLYFHLGSVFDTPMWTRDSSTGTNFTIPAGTLGSYNFAIYSDDTKNWLATVYWFDIWVRTVGNREYPLTFGTFTLKSPVGTI